MLNKKSCWKRVTIPGKLWLLREAECEKVKAVLRISPTLKFAESRSTFGHLLTYLVPLLLGNIYIGSSSPHLQIPAISKLSGITMFWQEMLWQKCYSRIPWKWSSGTSCRYPIYWSMPVDVNLLWEFHNIILSSKEIANTRLIPAYDRETLLNPPLLESKCLHFFYSASLDKLEVSDY